MFTPLLGPPDFVGRAGSLHDDPLIGGAECLGETGQGGLDQPRFERHSCGLAIGIEFLGHSQGFERRIHAAELH